MKLQQLKYFKTVCEIGSVSGAAQNLFISQSAISISIKELENEFGVSLFQRFGKRLVLTPDGQQLLHLSTHLLEEADELKQTMENLTSGHVPVRVGITTMMAAIMLPEIFRDFSGKHKDIKLKVKEGGILELLNLLSRKSLDFIIIPRNSSDHVDEYYNHETLADLEYSYCVNKKHRLAGSKSISVTQIANDPLITFNDGYSQKQLTITLFNKQGLKPNIVHSSAQLSTILEMIDKNDMGCFLFKDLNQLKPDLCFIPLEPAMKISIDLIWRRDVIPSHDEETIIKGILSLFHKQRP